MSFLPFQHQHNGSMKLYIQITLWGLKKLSYVLLGQSTKRYESYFLSDINTVANLIPYVDKYITNKYFIWPRIKKHFRKICSLRHRKSTWHYIVPEESMASFEQKMNNKTWTKLPNHSQI